MKLTKLVIKPEGAPQFEVEVGSRVIIRRRNVSVMSGEIGVDNLTETEVKKVVGGPRPRVLLRGAYQREVEVDGRCQPGILEPWSQQVLDHNAEQKKLQDRRWEVAMKLRRLSVKDIMESIHEDPSLLKVVEDALLVLENASKSQRT